MACKENEQKCFTFIWKLENISYCLQQESKPIVSPPFIVDELEKTGWTVRLYPRKQTGKYIGIFLFRQLDSSGQAIVEIKYDFAFIAKDGSPLIFSGIGNKGFSKGKGFGCDRFARREEIFISERSTFLPEDTLTARCRVWKSVGEIPQDIQCYARTRIVVDKRSFIWKLENFSILESETKCSYQIKSIANNTPLASLDLFVATGLSCDEIIRFKLTCHDQRIKFFTVILCLIDAFGNKVHCNQDEFVNNDEISLSNALLDYVKSLYDENFLCDVKLKTSTSTFPAHKLILSAFSSVFKAMFSNDMIEQDTNCVNIEDLSDDTISRMLLFIYTTRVEDLTWENASFLYAAADKYAILSLKDFCSSYIKDNLSLSNACEVLLLSDFHGDSDLKSIVQKYILQHGKQITNSEEWKALMQTNAKLAAETLCLLFK
ncbi:Speckle-type POZ protein [Araneus ventricosus]|uniref:Speckle-type POZ protein n=1 Tax=Araneus ventricosus TaxID=182803 RepID=A0A4Y2D5G1_ARAVE|nr:Speckle-type POZ protein [Araneus ventricosus]